MGLERILKVTPKRHFFFLDLGTVSHVIPEFGRLRQEGSDFEVSLGYVMRPHLKQLHYHKIKIKTKISSGMPVVLAASLGRKEFRWKSFPSSAKCLVV